MPVKYQIRDGLFEMAIHGKVTTQDMRQTLAAVTDIESRLPVTPDRIMDLSEADFSGLSSADVVAVAESRRVAPLKNKIKSAIIATQPEQFGLGRLFMGRNQNPEITIMIFKDTASAYQWLGHPAPL
jgi:hypothetical protein